VSIPSFGVFLDAQTFGNALFLANRNQYPAEKIYLSQSTSFVATQAAHTLIFAGELDARSNGAGTTDVSYLLDNVRLAAFLIPEPATWGLATIGAVYLLFGRTRAA
jgi:hypothetical protein